MDVIVEAILEHEKYLTNIITDQHQFLVDEPIDKGGDNQAAKPTQLLAASLASCTAITLKMYCERKAWDVGKISVYVTMSEFVAGQPVVFKRVISFGNPDVSAEQFKRFQHIADACPVHKILQGQISINTQFN